jgi:pilus assembly protein CpaE
MYLIITENSEEFSRLKLTLGRGLKQVKDRRELSEMLNRDLQHSFTLVIVGSGIELATALGISEELRVTFPTIGVILLRGKIDSSVTAQSLSAGIRDVVHMNDPEAIVVACKKSEDISRRQLQNVSQKVATASLGKIIVFHAPKDGLGVTTIAANMATDFAHRCGFSVCLVDSSEVMGDLAVRFRIEAQKSWLDLTSMQDIDEQALSAVLCKSKDGLDLLLSPIELSTQSQSDFTSFNQLIRSLQAKYQYVLIDTDSRFSEWNRNLLYLADSIVLVTKLDLATLKNLKIRLKELASLDIPQSAITLCLNCDEAKAGIKPKDIEELVGLKPAVTLPWDVDISRFGNEGAQIVIAKERSGLSHALVHATDDLISKLDSLRDEGSKSKVRARKSA